MTGAANRMGGGSRKKEEKKREGDRDRKTHSNTRSGTKTQTWKKNPHRKSDKDTEGIQEESRK